MKRDVTPLWAVLLSVAFCFGGTAAMVTGFSLGGSVWFLLFGCVILAALATFLLRYRFGWLVYSAALALLLLSKQFWLQGRYLCYAIGIFYSRGYGFALPGWLQKPEPCATILPLLLIAGVIAGVVAWTILYRRRAFWAVGIGLLPLVSCLVVTVTVPDTFAIVCLLGALALLILTQSTRRRDPRQGNRLCAMLSLPVLAGLVLLVALVPRESYRPIQFPQWMSHSHTQTTPDPTSPVQDKLSNKVDFSKEGYRNLPKTRVMVVTTDYSGKLYLRGRHYYTYSGTAWNMNPTLREPSITPSGNWISSTGYSITISDLKGGDFHYIPYYPQESIQFSGGMVLGETGEDYTYYFNPLWEKWQQQALSNYPTQEELDYRHLPTETMDWAADIVVNLETPGDPVSTADAVKQYVQNSAAYDLDTPYPPDGTTDFVYWFLNESDTGYCVHFASAATVLLRAAGVPARYVEGYAASVTPQAKNNIRGDMAHAWVEYYVNGLGWVVLDPTPAEPESSTPPATTAPTTSGESTSQATTGATSATATTQSTTQAPTPEPEASGKLTGVLWVLLGVTAALMLIVIQWLLRRYFKLRKLRQGHPNRQALARFTEAKKVAKLQKKPVPDELRTLAEKAKFSNHSLTSQELAQFDRYTAESIQSLCRAHWYWHLVLRLIFALR